MFDCVVMTQYPLVLDLCYEEFPNPSLRDFVGGDRDEMLLCCLVTVRYDLSRTEHFCPDWRISSSLWPRLK